MYDLRSRKGRSFVASILVLAALLLCTACAGGLVSAMGDDNTSPDPSAGSNPLPQDNGNTRNGVTSAFGIPAGMEGTVATGESLFNSNCSGCHGNMGARNFGQINTALVAVGSMKGLSLSQQQVADITAYLNRASIPPATDPGTGNPPVTDPPATDPPPSQPDPGTNPDPATGDSLTGFGIPTGLSGSISAGEQVFSNNCSSCHGSMGARSFGTLESAIANVGAMRSIQLSQQELADLTAWLNRASAGGGSNPGTGTGGSDDDGDDDGIGGDDDDGDDDSMGDDDGEHGSGGDDDEGEEEDDD